MVAYRDKHTFLYQLRQARGSGQILQVTYGFTSEHLVPTYGTQNAKAPRQFRDGECSGYVKEAVTWLGVRWRNIVNISSRVILDIWSVFLSNRDRRRRASFDFR